MVFGFFKSIRKSQKLLKYSNVLASQFSFNNFDDVSLLLKDSDEKDNALQGIIDLAFNDQNCLKVIRKHNITREHMEQKYSDLLDSGAGQVQDNHFVAASALVYEATLDFLFDAPNINKKLKGREFNEWVAYFLVTYFQEGKTGSVIEHIKEHRNL